MSAADKAAWIAAGVALGLLVAGAVIRTRTGPEARQAAQTDPTRDQPAVARQTAIGPLDAIDLADVYTSEEAARQGYHAEEQRRALAQRAAEVEHATTRPAATPFLAFFGQEEPELAERAADPRGTSRAAGTSDEGLSPTAQEVAATIEAFLRDAVMRRDVREFAQILDDDFRYTYDAGTPAVTTDDRVYERETFERVALPQLFDPVRQADVALSEPRDFAELEEDVATIVYDYDIHLWRPGDTDRVAGTASFLLRRDPTAETPAGWRILDWVDSPPRRDAR